MLGFYRPFIKNFAAIASPLTRLLKTPLTRLLKKDVYFHLDAPQEKSFQQLKLAVTHAPVLVFRNLKALFELCTDASSLELGTAFIHRDERGKSRVIAHAGRVLTPAEANYSVTH